MSDVAGGLDVQDRIDEIWDGDLLGRRDDARFLIGFLARRAKERAAEGKKASFVLNLDSAWGQGKSFFLKRMQQQLEAEGYLSVYIDAWRDDHADDPLVALMAALDDVLSPHARKKAVADALTVVKRNGAAVVSKVAIGAVQTAIKRYVGTTLEDLRMEANAESEEPENDPAAIAEGAKRTIDDVASVLDKRASELIGAYRSSSKSIDRFRYGLEKALKEVAADKKAKLPFFILIDELDRCRPTYAIALLERAKHLFEVDNVVFVVATDTEQLRHSIRGAYGGEFDGRRYLKRFFDTAYEFPKPSVKQFVVHSCRNFPVEQIAFPHKTLDEFFTSSFDAWNADLRSFNHWLDTCRNVVTAWPHQSPIEMTLLMASVVNFYREQDSNFPMGVPHWILGYTTIRTAGGFHEKHAVTVSDIYSKLIGMIGDIPAAVRNMPQGRSWTSYENYVYDVLQRETGHGAVSVLTEIPSLVRSSGRLKS